MIWKFTVLNSADNSGAKKFRCIGLVGVGPRGHAGVGNIIKVSVISAEPNSNVAKGTVHKAVIVRVKAATSRGSGVKFMSHDNAAVLLSESGKMVGTRVLGSVARECKNVDPTIVSRAQEVH